MSPSAISTHLTDMPDTFDFVIVGAGSAGCVLANRLTEDGTSTVRLLEFGGSDASIFIQMPSALSIPMNSSKYDWRYQAEPEPTLGGRSLHTPRGKVIGGSSSINGMVYVRGNAMDFEGWEAEGARGWAYAHVLPYFRRSEGREEGGDAYRGAEGPLKTSYGSMRNPLYAAFVEAARQAGYPATADVNGYQQEGFGRMDMTVHRGRRWSAANAYLKPAAWRANLSIETRCARDADPVRGAAGGGRRVFARGQGAPRHGTPRGDPVGGADQRPAAPQAVRHRFRRGASRRSASRRCTTFRGSAKTCRTTSNSTSRWPPANRSRSIPRSTPSPKR